MFLFNELLYKSVITHDSAVVAWTTTLLIMWYCLVIPNYIIVRVCLFVEVGKTLYMAKSSSTGAQSVGMFHADVAYEDS